jgi:hypothetical protein
MNATERKYRFSEIMSTVSLLPDVDMESHELASTEGWVLPNSTDGLSDSKIRDAIISQTVRENTEFKFKVVALLCNTATNNINSHAHDETKPTEDDLEAFAISAHVLWSIGHTTSLFGVLGMLAQICENFDMQVPKSVILLLRPNSGFTNFGNADPFKILEGVADNGE